LKNTFIAVLYLSLAFSSSNKKYSTDKFFNVLQEKFGVQSPEDFLKLRSQPSKIEEIRSSREMADFIGEWERKHVDNEMYVTTSTDKTMGNWFAIVAMDSAEGSVTASHEDGETVLNYLLDMAEMESDEGDENGDGRNRNSSALNYAQDYVDRDAIIQNQTTFDLITEFNLIVDSTNVSGGLGGNDPSNCQINWPQDPYKMAVYSFVSEYVLNEGASVGCFVDSDSLDQMYESVALDMESGWSGDDDGDDDGDGDHDAYTYGPRIAAYLTDLDPGTGNIYFDDSGDVATITFIDVSSFGGSTNQTNTFQIQLVYSTGEVIISYKDLSLAGSNASEAPGGLAVGLGDGEGVFNEVDMNQIGSEVFYNCPVEAFGSSNDLDLEYTKLTFTPSADYSAYSMISEIITELPGTYSNSISIDDDNYQSVSLLADFQFYDNTYSEIFINNDGNIGFDEGDTTCVCWSCEDGEGQCAAQYLVGGRAGDDGDDDGDDEGSKLYIMNLNFTEFMLFAFGIAPERVDDPLVVILDYDTQIVMAQELTPFGQEPEYIVSDSEDWEMGVIVDTLEQTITFNDLSLSDRLTGQTGLTLNGTIGAGTIDFIAGVETEINFPSMFSDMDEQEDQIFIFYDDSSGIDIDQSENDYGDVEIDTTEFYWHATSDSIFLTYPESEEEEELVISGSFIFSADSLYFTSVAYECGNEASGDCGEEMLGDFPIVRDLEYGDIANFSMVETLWLVPFENETVSTDIETTPEKFMLHQSYPNPFNPITTIKFDIGSVNAGLVTLKIYNIAGRNVATLLDKTLEPGLYEFQWNAINIPSGVYFSELTSGTQRQTQKMILLK
tara:strand:- start:34746 stop:37253 length:2508 start_codon:yes stop_codon:yes gene_type:complete